MSLTRVPPERIYVPPPHEPKSAYWFRQRLIERRSRDASAYFKNARPCDESMRWYLRNSEGTYVEVPYCDIIMLQALTVLFEFGFAAPSTFQNNHYPAYFAWHVKNGGGLARHSNTSLVMTGTIRTDDNTEYTDPAFVQVRLTAPEVEGLGGEPSYITHASRDVKIRHVQKRWIVGSSTEVVEKVLEATAHVTAAGLVWERGS